MGASTIGTFASLQNMAYLAAALLFILALARLSKQQSARGGNMLGAAGMALALVATVLSAMSGGANSAVVGVLVLAALGIGAAAGIWRARSVQMTQMPELVAMLHSFVGAAAVLVGWNSCITQPPGALADTAENAFHLGEVGLAVLIGAVTLSGSIVAFLKLSGKLSGKPVTLPGRNFINLAALVVCAALIALLVRADSFGFGVLLLALVTVISLALGLHLVAAIGGGDMPVVVSMLNSYSGWAAAMAGFTLGNDLLIITGALVGASGAYLSYIMCQGMNRSFASVILGGFGDGATTHPSGTARTHGTHTETTPEEVADMLRASQRVVVAPGYGMATAQAQFAVADLARRLADAGASVQFAIHPVAGRMPGHMNVLLAEAKVPYASVLELEEINNDFENVDTVLVIGANDTVNPAAETEPDSPIAGMPVLRVWDAANVVVFKRFMGNAGYSGVDNPLFYGENTRMLLGDAKESVEAIIKCI